jgi:PmbA protein
VNALDLAVAAVEAAGGGEAIAEVTRERSLSLRFAANRPTQATAVDDLTLELAVLRDGHVGRAATNAADAEAVEACARRANAAAEAAALSGGPGPHPGCPAPRPIRTHEGHDPETAALDPAVGGAALAAAAAACEPHDLEAHGIWTAGEEERAVATSAGLAVTERRTDAFMKVICLRPGGRWEFAAAPDGRSDPSARSGYAARAAVASSALDPRALAERAAAKALAGGAGAEPAEPAELPPGEYPVVMEPHALGELLELLAGTALNGLAHAEGRGALVDRLGTKVAAPAVNLADSPRFAATLPRAFDAEGVPKEPMPLIQDGVAMGVTHDLRSAALAGAASTGHALAPGGSASGPEPVNLVLAGGGAADVEELCAPIERGVYITRLWYSNVVRPKETLVTAVTRDGTFLIEDGAVTRPLRDLRLTDSVLGMLSRVQALTGSQQLASAGEFYGRRFATGVVCPAVRVGSVRFTDAAG